MRKRKLPNVKAGEITSKAGENFPAREKIFRPGEVDWHTQFPVRRRQGGDPMPANTSRFWI
ncbi:MAG: hypothetical protein AB4352_05510 [Hormoscilla sp.]